MTFKEGRLLEEAESVFEETNRNTEKQTEEIFSDLLNTNKTAEML